MDGMYSEVKELIQITLFLEGVYIAQLVLTAPTPAFATQKWTI